jgi:hypothetical protein
MCTHPEVQPLSRPYRSPASSLRGSTKRMRLRESPAAACPPLPVLLASAVAPLVEAPGTCRGVTCRCRRGSTSASACSHILTRVHTTQRLLGSTHTCTQSTQNHTLLVFAGQRGVLQRSSTYVLTHKVAQAHEKQARTAWFRQGRTVCSSSSPRRSAHSCITRPVYCEGVMMVAVTVGSRMACTCTCYM